MAFQPYYTVDYFASQGIKFKEQEKPQDHFDQQLRSFTEWLKTLKKIPVSEISATVSDPGGEKKAEQLAEHSLAERHVVTEAMAEVWIKQGNRAKAEEIYRKLSLLDPPKTAYFAAKIEELKKTSYYRFCGTRVHCTGSESQRGWSCRKFCRPQQPVYGSKANNGCTGKRYLDIRRCDRCSLPRFYLFYPQKRHHRQPFQYQCNRYPGSG
jgi:hypothetical protein